MAKLREEKQPIRNVFWEEYEILLNKLAHQILNTHSSNLIFLHGIPRGGLIVATALTYFSDKFALYLENPISNNYMGLDTKIIVVDDIVDSGDTAQKYFDHYEVGTLFWRKGASFEPDFYAEKLETDVWIHFPWERSV